ncbi:hypothetical protein [Crocosphaera chwakensis]|uniref:Uncharacterized protein n=1 Tax=Crocosphaera chwakensis CCY0110 TaxID=391612 RepID=A3IZV5_9CHRO|nr:hypothetical protein [Crocosphaera chwakensis]EAZ87996.1 hypothetical protein CY0110_00980 [Crocosphaera chwakensis CCY0110]
MIPIKDFDAFFNSYKNIDNVAFTLSTVKESSTLNQKYITDENFINTYHKYLVGVLLYTEEDNQMVEYVKYNYQTLDTIITGWLYIYVLEKPHFNLQNYLKYWKSILGTTLYERISVYKLFKPTKPFDKNESIKIAAKLQVPIKFFPCMVLLPPFKNLSGEEKLIIPIKEVSKEYFRYLFSILKELCNKSVNVNKYESIKINFESILQYLKEHSEEIDQEVFTRYQVQGTNIFVNSSFKRLNMTENNPDINITKSNVASVTGFGKIDTAIVEQYNFSPEEKKNLEEVAKQIQDLLNELSKTYFPPNPANNLKIATETIERIEKNSHFKTRIVRMLKAGGQEALKELINHPAINILMASIEGWNAIE